MTEHRVSLRLEATTTDRQVRPDTVHLFDVMSVMTKFARAVMIVAGKDPDADDRPLVSLVSVEPGSLLATLEHEATLDGPADRVAWAIRDRDFRCIPERAHVEVHAVSEQVKRRSWVLSITSDRWSAEPPIRISELEPVPTPSRRMVPEVVGTTTLYARVLGLKWDRTRKLWLRPEGQRKSLAASVEDENLARDLGERLLQDVAIRGEARWHGATWELLGFKALELVPYRRVPIVEAFSALRDAVGGALDDVDPLELTRELRSE